ncbi:MAG: GTPase ObgE [Myxococcales bacterium]|nr:GTPase ObgE [Myxococcales bacterium]
MHFIDQATIIASSGAGGVGSRHFRREKHVPQGGPDGGDGGRGGDVQVVADDRSRSLLDYHYLRQYAAEPGKPGQGQNKTGRDGAGLVLQVPPGTQVYDADSGELLVDLCVAGQRAILLRGGNGGWGNVHFATATRQAPDRANQGQPTVTLNLRFDLKMLADVALVGLPNVGKSSLIRAISASQAVVADYPFTTLVPNLGVVRHKGKVFTVADIPGLIAGAAQGAGLGLRFLRHVERCRLIALLVSPTDEIPAPEALATLRAELAAYQPGLADRPQMVLLSKADLLGPEADDQARELAALIGEPVMAISAVARTGLQLWLDAVAVHFERPLPAATTEFDPCAAEAPVVQPTTKPAPTRRAKFSKQGKSKMPTPRI